MERIKDLTSSITGSAVKKKKISKRATLQRGERT
jgi:hypothetical protein